MYCKYVPRTAGDCYGHTLWNWIMFTQNGIKHQKKLKKYSTCTADNLRFFFGKRQYWVVGPTGSYWSDIGSNTCRKTTQFFFLLWLVYQWMLYSMICYHWMLYLLRYYYDLLFHNSIVNIVYCTAGTSIVNVLFFRYKYSECNVLQVQTPSPWNRQECCRKQNGQDEQTNLLSGT